MIKNRKALKIFLTILFILISMTIYCYVEYYDVIKNNQQNKEPLFFYTTSDKGDHLIAHAGGMIDDYIYTNSKEAYEQSIQAGLNFIEVDLQTTTDGHFVAIHDWDRFNKSIGKDGDKPLSLQEVLDSKIYGKYTPLDAKGIIDLLNKYPHIIMLTDKTRNVKEVARVFGKFNDRMIVQVFHIYDYIKALKYGIKYPTLRLKFGRRGVPEIYKKLMSWLNIKSIILGELSFNKNKDFIKELHDNKVAVILYGNPSYKIVDNAEQIKKYSGKYIDLVDSDKLNHL